MRDAIAVSHEMTTYLGSGAFRRDLIPKDSVVFFIDGFREAATPVLGFRETTALADLEATPLVMVVQREACLRIFGFAPNGPMKWHLSSHLRTLALALIECEAGGEAKTTLQLARSIELLCQIHAALEAGELVPTHGETSLGEMDVARIANARRILDQRWQEKLTIAELAKLAGLNRDKLVRGFREIYRSTIAEVLAERRLNEARSLLLASDLPVASVAYQCSYLNNASFTRAFTRHFGLAPSEMRKLGVAA